MTFNRFFVWVLACAASLGAATPSFFDSLTARLETQGFEHLLVRQRSDSTVIVHYENRIYRNEFYAAGVVVALAHDLVPDSGGLVLVPSRRALPMCELVVDLPAYRRWVVNSEGEPPAHLVRVRDVSESLPLWGLEMKRPGTGKIDLMIAPSFSVYLGNYDDRFKAFFQLMPVVSTSLWRGAALYVEGAIPIHNDVNYQYYRFKEYAQLSKAAVNQMLRLPGNVLASVSYGVFNPNRWGIGAEVTKLLFQRRLAIGYSIEHTGFLLYYDNVWNYSKWNLTTSQLYAIYYCDALNSQFGISHNRYVMQDSGWMFEFSRNFHESSVGAFVGSTEFDKYGGLMIKFPLSRKKRPAPKVLRVGLPRYYEYSYRATNVVYTQHSPIQTGISVYTGNRLSYLYRNLTPNYVKHNFDVWRRALATTTQDTHPRDHVESLWQYWFEK